MNLQAQLIRATALLVSTLIVLGAIAFQQPQSALAQAPAAAAHPAAKAAASSAVILPTIHVRPTPTQLAQFGTRAAAPATTEIAATATPRSTSSPNREPLRAISRMDIPYYSFGKVLPRIGSKE